MKGNRKGLQFVILMLLFAALFTYNTCAERPEKEPVTSSGKEIPDFKFNIINSQETITKEQLAGKVYILDFWKTTCPRCQAQMGLLQDLFAEFSQEGLVMISLSLDKSIEDIEEFRKNNWAMPWIHVWVKDGWKDNIIKTFEVLRLPKLIIVGPDHKIICTNTEQDDAGIRKKNKSYF